MDQGPSRSEDIAGLRGVLNSLLMKIHDLEKKALVKGDLVDPLHLTVPEEIKNKIWEGKFVEFKELLKKTLKPNEETHKVTGVEGVDGAISLKVIQQSSLQKGPLSISQWSSAFHVFMSVLLLKNADVEFVQDLLAYAELIREAAKDHPHSAAWREYDEKFRSKKAADPARPWGMIDNQLWLSIFCRPSNTPEGSKTTGQNSKSRSSKACFFFNKVQGCRRKNCDYPHVCSQCGKSGHAAHQCSEPKKKSSDDQSFRTTSSKK